MAITMGKCRIVWGVIFILMLGCLCTAYSRVVGGLEDVPNFQQKKEIKNLAKYAVKEYNKQQWCFYGMFSEFVQNAALTFSKVVKAQQQVVAGTKYYLTLEAVDGAQSRLYRAIIYVKPWQNFKQLEEFMPVK